MFALSLFSVRMGEAGEAPQPSDLSRRVRRIAQRIVEGGRPLEDGTSVGERLETVVTMIDAEAAVADAPERHD